MGMKTQAGVLVLADISGFTAFVTATELEHGPQIIGTLLEAVMRRLAPPLEIQEVEGDARLSSASSPQGGEKGRKSEGRLVGAPSADQTAVGTAFFRSLEILK
jgi:hypothetical protein